MLFWCSLTVPVQATSFTFLENSFSTDELARSGGGGAISVTVLSNNPAAIEARQNRFSLHHLQYPAQIQGQQICAVIPRESFVWSGSARILDYGKLRDFNTERTFSARDIYIQIGLKSTAWELISWGVSGGFIRSKIDGSEAEAWLMSSGIRFHFLDQHAAVGISLEHLGQQTGTYAGYREKLPRTLRTSLVYIPEHLPARLSLDLVDRVDQDAELIGVFDLALQDHLNIIISTSTLKSDLEYGTWDEKILAGLAGGVRFNWDKWTLMLATQSLGPAGMVTAASITFTQ